MRVREIGIPLYLMLIVYWPVWFSTTVCSTHTNSATLAILEICTQMEDVSP